LLQGPALAGDHCQAHVGQQLIGLAPMGDLGQEVTADDKHPLVVGPALGGPLQGFDAPGAAELLLQAEAGVGDGGHQGRQQLHPDL
jgi:hypothetical protein